MQNLNSDELRKRLDGNILKMNLLTAENDLVVKLLKQRGLQAIDADSNDVAIHACVMQLDKLGDE